MTRLVSLKTFDGEFNVRAFGAVGDGVADDTVEINLALQAAFDAGGGNVLVPSGTYKISSTLIIRSNTSLLCDNNVTFNRTAAGAMLTNGASGENQDLYDGHGNITVRGGLWNINGPVVQNANLGFAFAHGENISFEGCILKDADQNHAIETNSCKNVLVKNCQFLGLYLGAADENLMEAYQIDLALVGTFGAFGNYDSTPCKDVLVENCYFGASGTGSTQAWPRAVGSHSGSNGFSHTDVVIRDNTFDSMTLTTIPILGYKNVLITGNIFKSCGAGIFANAASSQDISNFVITNNIFTGLGTVNPAIAFFPSDASGGLASGIIISGNVIDDCDATGIYIQNSRDVVIQNNNLRTVGQNGIHIVGGTNGGGDVSITNNILRGIGRTTNVTFYGIRLSTSVAGYNVSGNRIRKFGSGNEVLKGISATGTCTGGMVSRNDIQDTGFDNQGVTPATYAEIAKTATVVTSQTTSSTTYGDLPTAGPAVTVDTGTSAIVSLNAQMSNNTAGGWALMSFTVTGASSISASDDRTVGFEQSSATTAQDMQASSTFVITGLTAGSNIFTAKYRTLNAAHTATFLRRNITVIPLGI